MANSAAKGPARTRSKDGQLTAVELDAWRGLLRIYATLMRELNRDLVEAEGLALLSYEVLLRLLEARGRPIRMGDLAESLLISRSGLTGVIQDLDRRGYVVKERSATDGRGIEVSLTKAGRTVARRAQRVHLAGVRSQFLDQLTDAQLRQLTAIWRAVGADTGPDLSLER